MDLSDEFLLWSQGIYLYHKDFRPGIQFVNPNDTAPELV